MNQLSSRAGRYVQQPSGHRAFVPTPLPPDPPIDLTADIVAVLSRADLAVGRLDGVFQTLPNPDLFVAMYVRREAVDSTQIEGTQSTLGDVLAFELDPRIRDLPEDVDEVVNYVRAMNYGLDRLATLPLSLRLLREIHAELMANARGGDKSPGEFRATQHWIGPGGDSLQRATYVPPPPSELHAALGNLESWFHTDHDLPALVHCAIAHAQFETIHPFLDGNGRVGRLLIAFQLVQRGILHRPLLYLSSYLNVHRAQYYDRLMAVRTEGNWEAWMRFFLEGVAITAEEATATASAIVRLREVDRGRIQARGLGLSELRLHDLLFRRPLVNVALVSAQLGVTDVTAGRLIDRLGALGIVEEITGRRRSRIYRYTAHWRLFAREVEDGAGFVAPQVPESPAVDVL